MLTTRKHDAFTRTTNPAKKTGIPRLWLHSSPAWKNAYREFYFKHDTMRPLARLTLIDFL